MRDWMKYTLINSMVGGIFLYYLLTLVIGGGLDPSFAEDHPFVNFKYFIQVFSNYLSSMDII